MLMSNVPVVAADPFEDQVIPFLKAYCYECHNEKKASAELDLTKYPSTARLIEDFRQWEHVVAFVAREEMPPAKAKQPTALQRKAMLSALEKVLLNEAGKLAGDPGAVLPRRLSNAEFDYSIRDLTGFDIRPTSSFPLDPASGEGFNNTGEALTMSPSLFKKYYAAAQHVSDHAVLTTTGMKFVPFPMTTYADRQKLTEQAILRFYEQHNIKYDVYFAAAWLYRYRVESQKTVALEEWAKAKDLSPKYLRSLWDTLQPDAATDQFYIRWLRQRWNAIPAPRAPAEPAVAEVQGQLRAFAADIQQMSKQLCPKETPAIVADAGNAPIAHIERRKLTAAARDTFNRTLLGNPRFHYEFKKFADQPKIKLAIQLSDAGDGYAILKPTFSTSGPDAFNPKDAKKNQSLRAILAEYAPDELKKWKFGEHPLGDKIDAESIAVKVPAIIEIDVPVKAFNAKANLHLYVDARLSHSVTGTVGITVGEGKPANQKTPEFAPPLIDPDHKAAKDFETSGAAFCKLFPNRFVYVDDTRGLSAGFHLIEGFFRDDQPLCKSVLSDAEKAELDQLWKELYFVTGIHEKLLRGFIFFERSERNFLKHPDFDSIKEEDPDLLKDTSILRFKEIYLKRSGVKATGDALANDPINQFFEEIRTGIRNRNETLQRNEAIYFQDLERFAAAAYRRPLTGSEREKLKKFFDEVNKNPEYGIEHAMRASIASILVSPHFCYRFDAPPAGETVGALTAIALASRMSYFLWSSVPDEELRALAKSGELLNEKVLREQTRRMLKDPKVSRFALEFFGQWLGYRYFLKQASIDRTAFPAFDDALKQAMFEEPTRYATHLIQKNLPVTDLLSGDSTLVNKRLAQHYGTQFKGQADEWELVDGQGSRGRSGLLGMAVFLAKNSQPQRTSPVKRGFWVVHKLLGEHIPAPPADVVALPAKETETNGKTIRQLMKMHVEDNKCARCHVRFDSIGLSMEGFDAIGRTRTKDLAGRAIDNVVSLPDGKEAHGVPEFSKYLAENRKFDFVRTLDSKFLGYALGRSVQLSDQPLLEKMRENLEKNDFRFDVLFETVILSPQFRNQRCRDFSTAKYQTTPKGE